MKGSELIARSVACLGGLLLGFSAGPPPVFALQTHGGPEGLYVHQGGHLFLIFSLVIFLVNVRRSGLEVERAWQLLYWGAFLFVLWNIWAFIGHLVEVLVPESLFVVLPGRPVPSLVMSSWREAAYYVLKMDHLLCLPALVFFYAGLRRTRALFPENGVDRKRGRS